VSWHIGGAVPPDQDYRDLSIIDQLLQGPKRGVVMLGTSRIGKSSLLARIHEDPRRKSCEPINVVDGVDATLDKLNTDVELLLLDEAQALTKWSNEDLRKLRARIANRPFILAAWPTLLRSQPADELQRLLEDVRHEWLRPFSRDETARMLRRSRSSIPPVECGEDIVDAIHRATGGFPNLTAGLCRHLTSNGRDPLWCPTEENLRGFINSTECTLAARYLYTSLPPQMQRLLDDSCRATPTSLELLREPGLTSGNPAVFSGQIFSFVWGPGGEWEAMTPQKERHTKNPSGPPRPALTWLHISDLHFGAGAPDHRFNQEAVTEKLLDDVRQSRPWDPDFIFVTGDIAFSASPGQYTQAEVWLKNLAEAAGKPPAVLRLVPGNHDVDRKLAKQNFDTHTMIRGPDGAENGASRKPPSLLDERLQDTANRKALRKKLDAYVKFVNKLVPGHPKDGDDTPLDWCERLDAQAGRPGRVWLAGLCSVWVSDEHDTERKLVIGERQLRNLKDAKEEDLLFLLTHHPPGWLHPNAEDLVLERLAEKAHHVHLCGHVHAAGARALRGFGMSRDSMRLVAGAGHGESSGEHGYAWGALRWSQGQWELGWGPRKFERGVGMRPDRNRYNLDTDGFAWEPLTRLKWGAP
jgi:predicted MPP superfamily phosphohydrolase